VIQEGCNTLCYEMHILILFEMKKTCHRSGRTLLLYVFIKRVIKLTSNHRGMLLLPTMYKILSSILLSHLTPDIDKIIGVHQF
jgi:hypothetical protein